ncbi:zinc ribbon domain-containing protein [Alkalibacillus aidingensis]|uniref:zinc ribbon domain-containing protein n=1 Tax=Alkalibacillus aidingensis TaxID=2747607 RepID=UPI0016618435|nr:zinc ribbon domain-containing protein [Alkalibacillus aidingensis]
MSSFYELERKRLLAEKSWWLAKLGESIYHQYRMGNLYSEELKEFGEKLQTLDERLHQVRVNEESIKINYCVCGHEVDTEDKYCGKCGVELSHLRANRKGIACTYCQTELMAQANFCHVCGMRHEQGQEDLA